MGMNEHKERFDSVALTYNSAKCPGRYNCLLFVLDLLVPCDSDVVLDVGCGPGEQLVGVDQTIKFGYGIDLSEEMIKVAKDRAEKCGNLKFYVSSAETPPAELKRMGITKIFSNYALHHLPDDLKAKAIAALSGLLKPGGTLIVGDLMFSDDPSKYASLFDYVGYGPESDNPSTISVLTAMFEKANLKCTIRLLNPLSGIIIGIRR
jgi:ubiquinone/menaquinone biosynthesis C-methylase UbiE